MKKNLILIISCVLFVGTSLTTRAQELNGEAMLLVYPDYPVNTGSPYGYTSAVGHAGVLLINETGLTKYYEFGRYDEEEIGVVRQVRISNVAMEDGLATAESLKVVLSELSRKCGNNGSIRAAYFVNMDFEKMKTFAESIRDTSNADHSNYDPNRKKYSPTSYNCGHFAESVILKGNAKVDCPTILNPTPNNFVDEYIEEKNAEVLYNPRTGKLTIGAGDEAEAKKDNS